MSNPPDGTNGDVAIGYILMLGMGEKQGMTQCNRIPSTQRRAKLIAARIEVARAEGGRSEILVHLAKACGVTKPIVYSLFVGVTDLLGQMHQCIVRGCERAIREELEEGAKDASGRSLLEVQVRTYIGHSLGAGAVCGTVSAALIAMRPSVESRFFLPRTYRALARELLHLSEGRETTAAALFLDSADHLVCAVQTSPFSQAAAVEPGTEPFATYLGAEVVA